MAWQDAWSATPEVIRESHFYMRNGNQPTPPRKALATFSSCVGSTQWMPWYGAQSVGVKPDSQPTPKGIVTVSRIGRPACRDLGSPVNQGTAIGLLTGGASVPPSKVRVMCMSLAIDGTGVNPMPHAAPFDKSLHRNASVAQSLSASPPPKPRKRPGTAPPTASGAVARMGGGPMGAGEGGPMKVEGGVPMLPMRSARSMGNQTVAGAARTHMAATTRLNNWISGTTPLNERLAHGKPTADMLNQQTSILKLSRNERNKILDHWGGATYAPTLYRPTSAPSLRAATPPLTYALHTRGMPSTTTSGSHGPSPPQDRAPQSSMGPFKLGRGSSQERLAGCRARRWSHG